MQFLTAPAEEPVSVAEAKLAARIAGTEFDAMLPGLITAARELAEQIASTQFMAQTWRFELVDWPAADEALPIHQATAAAVSYWTGSAWSAELSEAAYLFAPLGSGTALAPASGTSWPTLGDKPVGARVRIDLTVGAESAADVSESVKLFIKACVAFWVDNPQGVGATGMAVPLHLHHMLDRAKVYG